MKKRYIFFMLAAMIFSLSACKAQKPESKLLGEEELLNGIRPNIECLGSCVEEMFCAEVDFTKEYLAGYGDEASYDNGAGAVGVLFLSSDEEKYSGYYIDPTYSSYYPVSNFKTNEEVRGHLRTYMSDNVIDKWFKNDFLEYDGTLYLRRGSRGYGAVTCDDDNLRFLEQKDGKYYVEADFLLFDEYYYTDILEIEEINGALVITGETAKEH